MGVARRAAAFALAALLTSGCVTVAEFRKLERRVIDNERVGGAQGAHELLADTSAEIEAIHAELRRLQGRLEVVEKTSSDALAEARKARLAAASLAAGATGAAAVEETSAEVAEIEEGALSEEVQAYRDANSARHGEDLTVCIDRFRDFLQTYPASVYADDAAFWMADCHFEQGDLKNAVLRFDDVVRNYPTGNKAPDALYRQGESLLKLGPSYHEAARRAFERVLKEYPDSARAREASRQLELITSG